LDRLLLDKRFINYSDIIIDIKKDNKKRKKMANDVISNHYLILKIIKKKLNIIKIINVIKN
jgi:hypothetical protein